MAKNPIKFPAHLNLDRFISIQSHDLKTPFNHVIGFAKIVLRGQDGPLTDFQKEDLTTIYNSGMRALGFISSLVEIARINSGEKAPNLQAVDIRKVVEEAVTLWKKSNPTRNFEFESSFACTCPTFNLDEVQIRQAIIGLMTCTAEYVEGTAKFSLRVEEEPEWMVVFIQSTGKKAPTRSELDLEMNGYISRSYIEQHGGTFRTLEENEDGATISFAIPKK